MVRIWHVNVKNEHLIGFGVIIGCTLPGQVLDTQCDTQMNEQHT